MEALINSTLAVAIAEIGDKTQLLSLFLASRFSQRYAICAGILVATILNHAVSAWAGAWLIQYVPADWGKWLISLSFFAVALWILVPDKDDDTPSPLEKHGAFIASTVLFFLAEIGDKTQIATVLLAAKYPETFWVVLGTTLGMLAANVPVVFAGSWLMEKMPLQYARIFAFILFAGLGVATLMT
jgi:putative Ca2+/H+ antiporter (TMEM165/GDT1 family)